MRYEVPIDLNKYGWNETLVNFLNDEDVQGLIALDSTALEIFSRCLEMRDEMLDEEYRKVLKSYSIANFENVYSAPSWLPKINLGSISFPLKIAVLGIGTLIILNILRR